jgi:hypothetical protein
MARGRKRTRTSTSQNPRQSKRPRNDTENEDPTPGQGSSQENPENNGAASQVPELREGMTVDELYAVSPCTVPKFCPISVT